MNQERRDLSKNAGYLIAAGIAIPIAAIVVPILISRNAGSPGEATPPVAATSVNVSPSVSGVGANQAGNQTVAGGGQVAAPVLLWRHSVGFPSGQQGLRLADGQPRVTDVGTDFRTATWGDGRPGFEKDSGTAGTVGKGSPTVHECQEALISSAQDYSISTDVGSSVCFLSGDSRFLAAVTVTSWDFGNQRMTADVSVWRLTA
jgi:hypothetical protein